MAGLKAGWQGAACDVGWVLTALGSVLPFLIPVVLIGGIAFEIRRRLAAQTLRRRRPARGGHADG